MKKLLITLLMTVALLLPQTLKAAGYTGREAGWLTDTDGTYTAIPGIQFVFFNEANFPDPTFRSALMDLYSNYGFKRYGQAVCPQHLSYVEILKRSISDFKGIEFFTNAKVINIASCQATKLDLTHNTALTWLRCSSNNLTSLTLPNTTTLTFVDCHSNQLTELDVKQNTALTSLYCGSNTLTELDVSANAALQTLDCWGCQLKTLDVTQNTVLIELSCGNNQLTGLDVTQNTMLNKLSFTGNMLTEIDLSNNDALTFLQCGFNKLSDIDLRDKPELTHLECSSNRLNTLDLTQNTKLQHLDFYNNTLREIDLSHNPDLRELVCWQNQLMSLDLSNNPELRRLECYSNHIRALDLSMQTKINNATINPQGGTLDVLIFSNSSLGFTYPLTVDPDRVNNVKVANTLVTFNDLELDGSNYHQLAASFSGINDILWNKKNISYSYDVRWGTEGYTSQLVYSFNPNPYVACGERNGGDGNFPDASFRTAIQDNAYDKDGDGRLSKQELTELTSLNVSHNSIKSLQGIEYMKYLETLDCSDNNLKTTADLPLTYPGTTTTYNPDLVNLNCSSNQLTGIDVTYNTKLQTLDCSHNKIVGTLNLSTKSNLVELHCSNNMLTGLTLPSTKTALVKLTCNDNKLSSLSAAGYTAMTLMDCSNNLLKSLTVAGNSKLETFNCANNQLTSLTLPTTKTALLELNCNDNQLTALSTINQYTNLTDLNCGVNKLTTLNLTGNTKLETLDCASQIDRSLKRLTLPHTTTLTKVYCNDNSLTELDLSNNTELFELDCSTNNLTALDLSANTGFSAVEAGYLDYSNQTRSITAESAHTPVTQGEQTIIDKFYYLRLDNQVSGAFEKSIWGRMTETNYGRTASTFLPERVVEWVSGGQIIEGTRGKSNAAGVGDVNPNMVYGDILFLTDVTESDGVASGTVTYTYNVNNPIDPDGNKGNFTLNWTASAAPDVVTEVTDLGAMQREPVAVEYHNLAGMSSDRPWQGLNIVVTRYSDGTTETSKILR